MSFTWIPLYREIAEHVLAFQERQEELLDLLKELSEEGVKVIALTDRNAEGEVFLSEIDPLTFFASFNRTSSVPGRQKILARIKDKWHLTGSVPTDFDGIPVVNPQKSWFFPFQFERNSIDVPTLWRVAREGVNKDWRTFDQTLLDEALDIKQVGLAKLSMALFWLNPRGFLPCDKNTRAYLETRDISLEAESGPAYIAWLKTAVESVGDNFPTTSFDAYNTDLSATDELAAPFHEIFATAEEAQWGFDLIQTTLAKLGVTASTAERDERICLSLRKRSGEGLRLRLNFGNWAILTFQNRSVGEYRMQYICRVDLATTDAPRLAPGDRFANEIDGHAYALHSGTVAALRNPDSPERKANDVSLEQVARRFSDWKGGPYQAAHRPDILQMVFDSTVRDRVLREGLELDQSAPSDQKSIAASVAHWWLNANPRMWDPRNDPIGSLQTYTSHNEQGNKRQKYKHFASVRPGDLVLMYLTNPIKEIAAVCKITKSLHAGADGEAIEFQLIEKLREPVTWTELQSIQSLAQCEPVQSNQGSLFAVSEEEYDIIRAIIDERNPTLQFPEPPPYSRTEALNDLFMSELQFDRILDRLARKKAIIVQGPPGVGKTFVARRLAFAKMGQRDERRISMVQFHPSYGYEDFVQGYRPSRTGLEPRDGVFYDFARLARNDPDRDWFFVIDEINRGNLAKIFGELLMLLESDKRGPEYAIPLTYSEKGEVFHLPANLHVIGTMNTADRSLAMVDYALRRRFAFESLDPAFDSPEYATWLKKRGATDAMVHRIRTRIKSINTEIEKARDLGPGFRIGHSYFCPANGQVPNDAWYKDIIESELQPLLEEYFDSRDQVNKLIDELLG